jgi:serine/threonine protein kinase
VATPRYASPQVLDGQRPDARDDVYSLACLAYVLLSGKHPFGEKTALGAQEQRLRPSRPAGLSWKEWRALRAGLAFDRERRPSDVAQWLNAFDWSEAAARLPLLITLVRVPARKPRPWAPALATVAVVAALAAAVWASGYFDIGKRAASSVTSESDTQSAALPTQSDDSSTAVQATRPSPAAQPAHIPPAQPADRAANPPPSSAPAPAATPSPTSPPPSSSANARAPLAAGSHGTSVETSALPRSRIELAADTIDVPLTDPAARIIVRRRGSLQGAATFTWWTESGTAKPGQDFMAVSPHQEVIEEGKSSVSLFIPIVSDTTRQQPKSFYVVINDPGPGVTLGARTLTMVTIPPSQ